MTNENTIEGSNPFIKEFFDYLGGIMPINMSKMENNKMRQEQFAQFIKYLTRNIIQKNRVKFILWGEHDELVELYIQPDFQVEFKDNNRRLEIISLIGKYALSIPYHIIDTMDVRIPGEYSKVIK